MILEVIPDSLFPKQLLYWFPVRRKPCITSRSYFLPRVVGGFIRKRESASPRFCKKASEL
jgi:hypothetical protein